MGKRTLLLAILSIVLSCCKVKEHLTDVERVRTEYLKKTDTLIQKEIEVHKGDTIEKRFHTLEIRTIHDKQRDTIYINNQPKVDEKEPQQTCKIPSFVKIITFIFVALFIFHKLLKIR